MWLYYVDGLGKDNKYLLPGKNGGPLSYNTSMIIYGKLMLNMV